MTKPSRLDRGRDPSSPRRPARSPVRLALGALGICLAIAGNPAAGAEPATGPESEAEAERRREPAIAAASPSRAVTDLRPAPRPPVDPTIADPIAAALDAIAHCQRRYAEVRDYRCTFIKRERINGVLLSPHVMTMKARSKPHSIYFKFDRPNKGREAIFVEGRNRGRVVAHDVGLFKVLAGTMNLDPRGTTAMEDCRHPITEAGIGSLIETVAKHWALELRPADSVVTIRHGLAFDGRRVTMIESTHPEKKPEFMHHMVRLYIDHEHGLPIRFEAYDWPRHRGGAAELLEEYSYTGLELNVGLTDHDFDPSNVAYSFGRF